ncbi:MAG: UDP-3-O-acyl-N-acetylglucosamine deacetylase, partial [Candidatus Omnitrophica bacterium]|nr:UDP-3-O-acyl-N-acetylglucosamine deacetylase [Candidatus Omnitrophota bacterium]
MVEIDGEEVPGMDGSSLEFTKGLIAAGLEEQGAERQFLTVTAPVYVDQGDQSIVILPADSFSISYMLSYRDANLLDQYLSLPILPEIFERELAPARTFCLKKEAELLLSQGFGKGANPSNTLIFEKNQPIQNTLRFENEACRHKMMDILGDLFLCGKFIRGHVIASRSGHALNVELVRKLMMNTPSEPKPLSKTLNVEEIQKIIPHRYPFL